ncbi:DUF368 domain-containing protein [Pseudonocardia sp. ICBG162]|uniref:DUF368 domain-containing protein n=1 Tax=Pseudonocardia sp. ICBG162 TaxID=2846761 RepID=UPI001CF6AB8C|nr:DUF368 domain-containing protein [Pseudonocardia sp. ICBG162]
MSGIHLARGAAIGVVETIPGVSGGTMALVVGIYERLIAQGAHLVGAARGLLPGAAGGDVAPREELRRLDWDLLLPVALGMVLAVLAASQVLPGLIEDHPVGARAVFLGMVAASVAVPLRITGRLRGLREWALVVVAFAGTFAVSALPPAVGDGRPPMPLVALAAAVAVCALVLPGFSGSFLLLVFGLYEPTLRAVRDLDLAYIAVFGLGAVLGLASFVSVLTWLLEHHRRTLMVIMIGVLLGALRALWPWQDDARGVLAPDPGWWWMLLPAAAGAAVVLAIMAVERRVDGSAAPAAPDDVPGHAPEHAPDQAATQVMDRVPGPVADPGGNRAVNRAVDRTVDSAVDDADVTRPIPRVEPPPRRDR